MVCIDGLVVPEAEARVPVTDRGFLYGDSVYEVIRTYGGRPYLLSEHLERLRRSAVRIRIPLDGGLSAVQEDIRRTLAATENLESYIRVVVTRGSGPVTLDPSTASSPRRVVMVGALPRFPEAMYEEGVTVCLVSSGRSHCGVLAGAKSGNYLVNVLALEEARRKGAHEAILLDVDGRMTEGASSNLFLVRAGSLVTPPLDAGILEGITRRQVCRLAQSIGLSVQEQSIVPDDLAGAQEAFLTSTLREVLPIRKALLPGGEEVLLGGGRPGAITRDLMRAFRAGASSDTEIGGLT